MNFQTVPAIEDMTASQKVELMDKIWRQLAPENFPPPNWENIFSTEAEANIVERRPRFTSFEMMRDFIECVLGIRRGLDDMKAGRVTSAEQVFWEFEEKFGIPHNI